ncbi:uncharacterized protein [Euwallacea fornicatus]|uniref:uncharacterized protein isoform X2 n=1 Tax=Euwallacea fornicatus TaxID=995702 RepID=UPI00338E8C8B
MDEEDEMILLDFRSPKTGLIKLLEQKMKKPDIDDTLGKVLDQFFQLTKEQSTFLANGIFQMNFNEDALLLQCCGQYYSKMVDKLWEELLQFHTRMVKYDQRAAKYCTDSDQQEARKEEMARLEERLNRGKRKKVLLEESEAGSSLSNGLYIFDVDREEVNELFGSKEVFPLSKEFEDAEEAVAPFEPNTDLLNEWWMGQSAIEEKRGRNYNSLFVSHYHALRYKLKHYRTPTGDEMIYDWNDPEEFNTREGRLISYHHIKHLFEDNDKCLLPDENFTIAKLRLAFALKRKWLIRNKIQGKANYESYRTNWEKYEKDFFDNESRKIQNMPQNTPKQLLTFYKALAKKEKLALKKVEELKALGIKDLPCVSFESVIIAPTKEGYEGIFDPYIPEDFEVSEQANIHLELLINQAEEAEDEIGLFGNVSKELDRISQSMEKQGKSDSGYLDTLCSSNGFVDDGLTRESESETVSNDNFYELDAENGANKGDDSGVSFIAHCNDVCPDIPHAETVPETEKNNDALEDVEISSPEKESSIVRDISPNVVENEPSNEMNKSIKDFLQYGSGDLNLLYEMLKDSYFDENDSLVTILYNKSRSCKLNNQQSGSLILDYTNWLLPVKAIPAIKKNPIDESRRKKRKLNESSPAECIPKRKKLSQRQIEKLKKSIVLPLRELKWEYFYSLNYQPENEEGEVIHFEYGEVSEDEDLFDEDDNEVLHDEADLTYDFYDEGKCQEDESEQDSVGSARIRESQDSGVVMDTSIFESLEEEEDCNSRDSLLFNGEILEGTGNELEVNNIPGDTALNSAGIEDEEIAPSPVEMTEEMTSYECEREKVRTRVTAWKEYITPKLKQLEECDFDIHEYGTKILRNMNVDKAVPFRDLVQGKSSAEVVRYFISSLQLANTLNVEICGATQGGLSNDTFHLKLLSTERYHEHLKRYQAPSEESLKDKLMKIKELRNQQTKVQRKQAAKRVVEDRHSYRQVSKKVRISNSPFSNRSTRNEDCVFQQSSSSQRTDKQGDGIKICDDVGDLNLTMSGTNADICFTPSCDEDFLEQFDRLQQINNGQLLSTPNKPIKIIRMDLVKPKISLANKL